MSVGFRKKCLKRGMTEGYKIMNGLEKQEAGIFKGSQSEPEALKTHRFLLHTAGSGSTLLPT